MNEFEYKKVTKVDVDFPAYCYFFIKKLIKYSECVVRPDDKLTIEILTPNHEYCCEAFDLVVKTMERKGIATRIPSFVREKRGDKDLFRYKFTLKKLVNYDDLPF